MPHAGAPGPAGLRLVPGEVVVAHPDAQQQDNDVEEALWTALRVVEERAEMSRRLAEVADAAGRGWSQEHFFDEAEDADRSAELLRAVLHRESDQPSLPTTATGP